MSVVVTYSCSGCRAKASSVVVPIVQEVGPHHVRTTIPSLNRAAPEGWVAFDPFARVTYCPRCWDDICGAEGPCAPEPSKQEPSV